VCVGGGHWCLAHKHSDCKYNRAVGPYKFQGLPVCGQTPSQTLVPCLVCLMQQVMSWSCCQRVNLCH
jgi:hypothetical protein